MKKIKKIFFPGLWLVLFFSQIKNVFAACTSVDGAICLENPIKSANFTELLTNVMTIFTQIMVPIVTLAVIYSGYLFVSAGGNPKKLENAKNALFTALLGALIVLAAFAITKIITATAGSL